MSKSKGSRLEREVASVLDELSCAVVRTGSSGAATDRPLPDLHAGHAGHSIAIEVKAGKRPSNLESNEARQLHEFAIEMGSEPVVAVRYDGQLAVYFVHLSELPRTDADNVSVTSVPEKLRELAFAVVEYDKVSGGVVVERGREDFHRGVMR